MFDQFDPSRVKTVGDATEPCTEPEYTGPTVQVIKSWPPSDSQVPLHWYHARNSQRRVTMGGLVPNLVLKGY
jgi:hypothetical protein